MKINFASSRNHSLPNALGALLLIAVLVNCTAVPSASSAAKAPIDNVQQLLEKAHAAPMETRALYLLDAAEIALQQNDTQQNDTQQAEHILQEIDELKLRDDQRARSGALHAQLLLLQGKAEQALTILQTHELQQDSAQLPAREQTNISLLRAKALAATNKFYASAQERIFIDSMLKDAELEQNHQEIQRALMNLTAAELQQYRDKANSDALRRWLELALAAKINQTSPLTDWSKKLPAKPTNSQPASSPTPGNNASQQIALLLPQSGKLANFGDAVRDGFFAALYEAKHRGEAVPSVRIYDTENVGIVALYQQAVTEGATAVIGPLEKNQVAQFFTQSLTVPLLALNRADTAQNAPANLYQFALAPEDETAQLATFAAKEKRANALVIVTEDEAHSHELEAFTQRWQSLGGTVAATALYRDQQSLSAAIRTALNIPRSEARAKEMESVLNRNIEFTPHRRRDIDMVFMLAKPAQARLIKPLLDFYYASDLPIYSTSRIYSGYSGADPDRDAEKVRFTEIPWVLQQSALKQQIIATRANSKNYLRLYALGIDSFTLYPRLQQMTMNSDQHVSGQTGMLSLSVQHIVQRELPLAEMRGGTPRVIDGNGILAETNDSGRDDNVEQPNTSPPANQ
ncbi:MAG: penicillin-binding protein activator [Verrucomicrobiaceae bacterium]|nr:penicillin-binding protein activator [Verrucomicrobiaceae bacterium]